MMVGDVYSMQCVRNGHVLGMSNEPGEGAPEEG